MIDWIIKNRKYLNVSGIGEDIGAKDQLLRAVNGSRKFPKKHLKKLIKVIKILQKPV